MPGKAAFFMTPIFSLSFIIRTLCSFCSNQKVHVRNFFFHFQIHQSEENVYAFLSYRMKENSKLKLTTGVAFN